MVVDESPADFFINGFVDVVYLVAVEVVVVIEYVDHAVSHATTYGSTLFICHCGEKRSVFFIERCASKDGWWRTGLAQI